MRSLKRMSLLKKIPFIALMIVVIAFFAIPSVIFAEGEGVATADTTQATATQETTVETSADASGTTTEPTDIEQEANAETATNDGAVTTETTDTEITTEEQAAADTSPVTETEAAKNDEPVNTEVVYSPVISTDKDDYNPGETVTVFGSGFKPEDEIELTFYKATGEIEFAGLAVANEQGNFIYTYSILGSAEYKLTAISVTSGLNAGTTFKDRATAEFEGNGPRLTGSQFYEEVMYVDVHRDLTPAGTDDNMIAFCIDLQHYLNDYTGDDFDVYGFLEYNANNNIPSGKNDSSLTWPLPASIQALANSFNAGWFTKDPGAVSDLDGDLNYTANEKAAAMQEAFWHLVSAASATDLNTFDYSKSGIAAIRPLVASILSRVDNIAGSVSINPTTDINYLKDNSPTQLDLNSHPLTINVNNYSGLGISGATVYLSVTSGQGYFLNGGAKVTQTSITTTTGGIGNVFLYADKNTFSGLNNSLDTIKAYVDVNGDGVETTSTYITPGGSILYPKITTFPTSRPSGSNQLLILTNLFEPTATASKEWRIPGEITVHKSDGVNSVGLAGAIISLLDGNGIQAMDAWGAAVADQTTDSNGDIAGFEGLAWGDYLVKESTAPAGYSLASNIPVTIPSKVSVISNNINIEAVNPVVYNLNPEVQMADTRIPSQFRLTKTNSVTGIAVPGATYDIFDSSGNLVERVTTGENGSVAVTLQNWGTYSVKEYIAPAGYNLDPASYSVTFNATSTSITLNVTDSPVVTGGGGTVTVAGLTEGGIQVLAFTGQAPVIPIAGLTILMAGLAMVAVTLSRRMTLKWKHVKK